MKTTHWSLTGAVLLLALVPWMTGCGRADEAEDKAAKAIEKLGGRIIRDDKAKGKPIVSVYLVGGPVTDAGLKHLAGLKQLQLLVLSFTQVTDAGLKHLAGLKQLHGLYVGSTKVTDAGLEHLAGLKQLRELDLGSTQVTDAGLKHLAGLKQLRGLYLDHTKVTDAGLNHLAGLKELQELHLRDTKVTGKGKADLKKALPKLIVQGK
jgi:hypothetical protein